MQLPIGNISLENIHSGVATNNRKFDVILRKLLHNIPAYQHYLFYTNTLNYYFGF